MVKMDKNEIIRFLEFEISTRRTADKQPGWSTWAILGSMAMLLWLMLAEIETAANLTYSNVIYIFILLSVSIDFIVIVYLTSKLKDKNNIQDSTRFLKLNITTTFFVVLIATRSIVILYLLNKISSTFASLITISCYTYILITFFTVSVLIIIFLFKLPIPENPKPKKVYIIFGYFKEIVWGLSCTFSVIGLLSYLYKKQIILSVPDWKVGLICFGLSILILLLFKQAPKTDYLKLLENIHRKISLDNMDIEEAKKEIDIVLFGLTLPDILQSYISDILNVHNELQKLHAEFCSEMAVIDKFVTIPADQLSDEDSTSVFAVLKSMADKPQEIEQMKSKLTRLTQKLSFRAAYILGTDRTISHKIEMHINVINESNEKLNKITCNSRRKLEGLKQKLDAKIRTPQQIASGDAHPSRA